MRPRATSPTWTFTAKFSSGGVRSPPAVRSAPTSPAEWRYGPSHTPWFLLPPEASRAKAWKQRGVRRGAGDRCGESLQMAFGKKHVEDRKAWLSSFVPGTFLDSEASRISYDDFVNKVRPAAPGAICS